jgi:predicted enzyme related to lactoylglutathione lyase
MEAVISNLLRSFERGRLPRRDLVQGLALIAASNAAPAQAQSPGGLKGLHIDHVSVQTSDLQRSITFYEKVFGWKMAYEDIPDQITLLGDTKPVLSLHHKEPFAKVDHFAIAVETFDKPAVAAKLQAMGITPQENLDYGFYIKDPEGMNVQLV